MKKSTIIIDAVIVAVTMLAIMFAQRHKIVSLSQRNEALITDNQTLLEGVAYYRVQDSLSAAEVGKLALCLEEYEKYRSDDAALIKSLKRKNQDLAGVATSQTETEVEIAAPIHDTIVRVDSVLVPMKAISIHDKWYDLEGTMTDSTFSGRMTSRDSLLICHTRQYRRFLWWKTKKVKDERFDIVSKNPHTEIMGFEHITIEQ